MVTIVWDVDDVLNDLQLRWLELAWAPAHPGCGLAYSDLVENPPDRLLGVSRDEYLASLDAFRHTPGYAEQAPKPEVLSWFERHGAAARHVALSAVPLHAAHISAEWVLRHYGRWMRTFSFLPSPRADDPAAGGPRDKACWLTEHAAAGLLIDDSENNVREARAEGLQAEMFPRPWNADAARPVEDLLAQVASFCDTPEAYAGRSQEGDL